MALTTDEFNNIVREVMAQIEDNALDFDVQITSPESNDYLMASRLKSDGTYSGIIIKWQDVAKVVTDVAVQAKTDAINAKDIAQQILTQVQSKGTEITNFVATSKAELETQKNESVNAVKSVYQTDLNELKGDLNAESTARQTADNTLQQNIDSETTTRESEVAELERVNTIQKYEIENLKAKAEGQIYRTEVVEAEAYSLDVPSSVAPYTEVQKIGGKSVVWNQLYNHEGASFSNVGLSGSCSNGVWTYSGTATQSTTMTIVKTNNSIIDITKDNKYYIKLNKSANAPNITFYAYYASGTKTLKTENVFVGLEAGLIEIAPVISITKDNSYIFSVSYILFDLTLMFGAGNEPTLEECQKIFSADYYPYDAGTIKSFPVQKVRSVGRNLYNVNSPENTVGYGITASTGVLSVNSSLTATPYIPVKEGETYYLLNTLNGTGAYGTAFYDSSKNYISGVIHNHSTSYKSVTVPTNAVYMRTTVLNSSKANVCINVSDSKNGTFTPYMESTLDVSSVTTDLKSAGFVYDEWSNGKIIKRVGSRGYTSGDESDSTLLTDGTTTHYPLATPTEEVSEIDNFIQVEGGGTLTFESDDTVHMPVPSTDRFVVDLT